MAMLKALFQQLLDILFKEKIIIEKIFSATLKAPIN